MEGIGLEIERDRRREGLLEGGGGDLSGKNEESKRPDPEVSEKPKRRRFSTEYKLRILKEADACTKHGETGALLRREGLYSSSLAYWRKQRREGTLSGLKTKRRGRKGASKEQKKIRELESENEKLRRQLKQARTVIDVQKKLSDALGVTIPEKEES